MPDLPPQVRSVGLEVDRRIRDLLATERARWSEVDPYLAEVFDELGRLSTGGKRLRAAFCYHAWLGTTDDPADEHDALDLGTAFELLQTFALIHDDIMDAADTRRGEATIHVVQRDRARAEDWAGEPRRFGEGVALLVGDLAHVYADQLAGRFDGRARDLWNELRIEVNLGQYLDIRSAATGGADAERAQRIAVFKSALYTIVRPLQMGAAITPRGASPDVQAAFHDVGMPIGRAFQLRDDLLGVLGDPDEVGKPVGSDLREGKATELIAIARDRGDPGQRAVLDTIGAADLDDDGIAAVLDALRATGAVDEIEDRITRLQVEADAALDRLPVPDEVRVALSALGHYVAARTR